MGEVSDTYNNFLLYCLFYFSITHVTQITMCPVFITLFAILIAKLFSRQSYRNININIFHYYITKCISMI